jgi:hypothetical protein
MVRGNSAPKGSYCATGSRPQDTTQVVLWGTKIRGNTDWGVAVQAQLCGFDQGDFSGHVSIVSEDIENNNAGGNQNGLGNPGDHPFKSLSDGQVCLP